MKVSGCIFVSSCNRLSSTQCQWASSFLFNPIHKLYSTVPERPHQDSDKRGYERLIITARLARYFSRYSWKNSCQIHRRRLGVPAVRQHGQRWRHGRRNSEPAYSISRVAQVQRLVRWLHWVCCACACSQRQLERKRWAAAAAAAVRGHWPCQTRQRSAVATELLPRVPFHTTIPAPAHLFHCI
jgi:hypothetical protein